MQANKPPRQFNGFPVIPYIIIINLTNKAITQKRL